MDFRNKCHIPGQDYITNCRFFIELLFKYAHNFGGNDTCIHLHFYRYVLFTVRTIYYLGIVTGSFGANCNKIIRYSDHQV